MSTLGQKPATQHVSTEKQTITGNGGTSYPLQQSVSQASDIEVFVNNTRQEPAVAYNASGTTLTMTGAVNSSDSFYVIFQGKAIQTAGLPVDAAITASTMSLSETLSVTGDATFDTSTLKVDASNNRVGVGTASPSKELDVVGTTRIEKSGQAINLDTPSSSQNVWINLSDNGSAKWEIQKNTANLLNIYSYDASANVMSFDGTGAITKPTQPAVYAYATTFTLPINTNHEVVFTTERYDQNSDFNTTNGHFTAPVTGKYLLTTSLYLYNYLDTDASYYYLTLFTSNDTVDVLFFTQHFLDQDSSGYNMQCSSVFDMDAGDVGKVILYQAGGAAITNIAGSHSNFTCTLLC